MRKIQIVLSALLGLISINGIYAHGVDHHIWVGGVGVEAHHEVLIEGEAEIPLSEATVRIYKPGHMDHPFQTGQTDIHGIFMFRPDTLGIWTVKFLTETGHGKVVEIPVNELNAVELNPDHERSSWRNAFTGVGLIILVFGLWMALKKKK